MRQINDFISTLKFYTIYYLDIFFNLDINSYSLLEFIF